MAECEDFDAMWERLLRETKGEYIPHPMDDPRHPGWEISARRAVEDYLERDRENQKKIGTPDFNPEYDFWARVDKGEYCHIPDYILDEYRNKK